MIDTFMSKWLTNMKMTSSECFQLKLWIKMYIYMYGTYYDQTLHAHTVLKVVSCSINRWLSMA